MMDGDQAGMALVCAGRAETSMSMIESRLNLMIGKNPLFVALQHGRSLVTMWRTYAAWMDGALESDIGFIRAAIEGSAPELVPSSVERDSRASGIDAC
jgi:hypothetical protein